MGMGMGYFSSPMSGYYHQMAPMSGMASQFMSPTGMYMGSMGGMSSMSSMASMQGERIRILCLYISRVRNSRIGFSIESLVCCDRKIDSLMRAIQSQSIFLKDRRERIDHGRSFLKIEKSERVKIEFPTLYIFK